MPRWVVIFDDTPEMLDIRADRDLRDAHVAFARERPELLIGGGLKPDPEAPFCGALWVVEADTREHVARLIESDPFYRPEFRTYRIFTWGKILEDAQVTL